MLTPSSPPCPGVPRTDDSPAGDPDRAPRKEPEPDSGEPERGLGPARLIVLCSATCDANAPQMAALLKSPYSSWRPVFRCHIARSARPARSFPAQNATGTTRPESDSNLKPAFL